MRTACDDHGMKVEAEVKSERTVSLITSGHAT